MAVILLSYVSLIPLGDGDFRFDDATLVFFGPLDTLNGADWPTQRARGPCATATLLDHRRDRRAASTKTAEFSWESVADAYFFSHDSRI